MTCALLPRQFGAHVASGAHLQTNIKLAQNIYIGPNAGRAPITHSMCNIIISKYVIATEATVFPSIVLHGISDLSPPCDLVHHARSINKPPNSLCSFLFHETKCWCVAVARRRANRDYLCHFGIVNGMQCTFRTLYLFTVSKAIRIARRTNYIYCKVQVPLAFCFGPRNAAAVECHRWTCKSKYIALYQSRFGLGSDLQKSLKITGPHAPSGINSYCSPDDVLDE